jgi:hypothetical protein
MRPTEDATPLSVLAESNRRQCVKCGGFYDKNEGMGVGACGTCLSGRNDPQQFKERFRSIK